MLGKKHRENISLPLIRGAKIYQLDTLFYQLDTPWQPKSLFFRWPNLSVGHTSSPQAEAVSRGMEGGIRALSRGLLRNLDSTCATREIERCGCVYLESYGSGSGRVMAPKGAMGGWIAPCPENRQEDTRRRRRQADALREVRGRIPWTYIRRKSSDLCVFASPKVNSARSNHRR